MQENMPEFLKTMTGVSSPGGGPRAIRGAEDVPLGEAPAGAETESILQRRERIRKAQEKQHPGSHQPTGVRSRKDILDELT
jgi:hypothetical protein